MQRITIASIDSISELQSYQERLTLLPDYLRERVLKHKKERDMLRSLLGYSLLRETYLEWEKESTLTCEVMKDELPQILFSSHGKPYFDNNSLYFNISHSKNLVACVLAITEIGIDIQYVKDGLDVLKLAKRYFAKEEWNELTLAEEAKRNVLFTTYFACKESCIKCSGEGMRKDLSEIVVDLEEETVYDTVCDITYHVSTQTISQGGPYILAVCTKQI